MRTVNASNPAEFRRQKQVLQDRVTELNKELITYYGSSHFESRLNEKKDAQFKINQLDRKLQNLKSQTPEHGLAIGTYTIQQQTSNRKTS